MRYLIASLFVFAAAHTTFAKGLSPEEYIAQYEKEKMTSFSQQTLILNDIQPVNLDLLTEKAEAKVDQELYEKLDIQDYKI